MTGSIVPFSMRPREAAKSLGITERTLASWEKDGFIKATRVGSGKRKTVLYPVTELQKLLDGLSVTKPPDSVTALPNPESPPLTKETHHD